MNRRRILRLLAGLAAVGAAASGIGASDAAFTDGVQTELTIAAGTLGLTHDGDGLVFDSAPLAPGGSEAATVTVRSQGTVAGRLQLHRETLSDTAPGGCAIADALTVRLREGETILFDGPLADLGTDTDLGPTAPGAARELGLRFTFPAGGGATAADNDNCFQGSVHRERLSWTLAEEPAP